MKHTIIKYSCDNCGKELKHEPSAIMSFRQNTYGRIDWCRLDVTIAYASSEVDADKTHLCAECKLYALNEAKKVLEHDLAEEQKGEQK